MSFAFGQGQRRRHRPAPMWILGLTLGSETKEGFTGKERDPETGLDYFGARYSMSALGRWGTSDPSTDASPEWSPYNYALDNPSGVVDPDGQVPVCLAGPAATAVCMFVANVAGGAIGGALGQMAANRYEGRGMFEGVGTAFLEGARTGAAGGLLAEGLGVLLGKIAEVARPGPASSPGSPGVGASVTANAAQGAAFEERVVQDLGRTQTGVVQHVTVKTETGVRTVIDAVGRDAQTGAVELTEAKSSATAPLTPNQRAAFPQIRQSGGTVVGAGKPGFRGGTAIPPTKVRVVRPEDLRPNP